MFLAYTLIQFCVSSSMTTWPFLSTKEDVLHLNFTINVHLKFTIIP